MKILTICAGLLLTGIGFAQDFSKVKIKPQKITKTVHMLQGAGGNIGVSVGEDGTFIIDDQFAPLSAKINKALKSISGGSPKFVINTHWHGDHTGGNENFGKSGSIIVAHENVRVRMKKGQLITGLKRMVPASPKDALPVVTFTKDMSIYMNGEKVNLVHLGSGHTDGDTVVHFNGSNVIHAGDVFFNGMFPFIDKSSGGSISGILKSARKIRDLSNDKTKIIPGHGPLASVKDIDAYIDMLQKAQILVHKERDAGLTLEAVQKKKPLKELANKWEWPFINQDKFVQFVYNTK